MVNYYLDGSAFIWAKSFKRFCLHVNQDIGASNWQPHNGRGFSDNIEAGNNNPRLEDGGYF